MKGAQDTTVGKGAGAVKGEQRTSLWEGNVQERSRHCCEVQNVM